jgi:hypothetical protein
MRRRSGIVLAKQTGGEAMRASNFSPEIGLSFDAKEPSDQDGALSLPREIGEPLMNAGYLPEDCFD